MKKLLFINLQQFSQKKLMYFLLFFVFFNSCSAAPLPLTTVQQENETQVFSTSTLAEPTPTVYLPLILTTSDSKFFGVYLKQYWTENNVIPIMSELDNLTGKKHSSVGWFIDLEDDAFTIPVTDLSHNNLHLQLESLWQGGYTSFINLGSNATATQIIAGERDTEIGYVAKFYKSWIDLGDGRKAMIAPLQEMNGDWTVYGLESTSEDYKLAYVHIYNIFQQNGIGREDIWWVFAPNGWNDPAVPERAFENYYPGDDFVDVIGFSSYNYGWCPSTSSISGKWESYAEMLDPYITRMEAMAPSKPIIIAETATTAYYAYTDEEFLKDINLKNQWLIDSYNFLATKKSVAGVYYFSFSEFDGYACDFEIINVDEEVVDTDDGKVSIFYFNNFFTGYKDGISNSKFKYLPIEDLNNLIR